MERRHREEQLRGAGERSKEKEQGRAVERMNWGGPWGERSRGGQ